MDTLTFDPAVCKKAYDDALDRGVMGPCARCDSPGCHPAIYTVVRTDGYRFPVCYDCLDAEGKRQADEELERAMGTSPGAHV